MTRKLNVDLIEQILLYIQKNKNISIYDIAEGLKKSRSTIYFHMVGVQNKGGLLKPVLNRINYPKESKRHPAYCEYTIKPKADINKFISQLRLDYAGDSIQKGVTRMKKDKKKPQKAKKETQPEEL